MLQLDCADWMSMPLSNEQRSQLITVGAFSV
jgi:hypothetical protein